VPFTDGMVNRVRIPAKQRFAYEGGQADRMPHVEIDTAPNSTRRSKSTGRDGRLCWQSRSIKSAVRLEEIASRWTKSRASRSWSDAASEHTGPSRGSAGRRHSNLQRRQGSCEAADSGLLIGITLCKRPGAPARQPPRRWAAR